MAADMWLGGCTNIDQFGKMTGIEFHVEGPVVNLRLVAARRAPKIR